MKAIVQDVYGEADVLRLEEIDRPEPGADEVLLRVHAAGVDRGVWHIMTGLPYPIRLAGYGLRVPKDRVRGREVAGRVEAVGKNVTTLKPGDDAYGIAEGSFAEYAVGRANKLALKPTNLTFDQAAATTISALTALQAVRDGGQVASGQKVLIIGASGGVGTFAVQIAKAFGAQVTGVASTAKLEMVRSAGADHVIDYTRQDITTDITTTSIATTSSSTSVATARCAVSAEALTPTGTLVIVGGETGGRILGGFDRSLRAPILSRFIGPTLRALTASENAADLVVLTGLVEAGKLTPVIDRTYPLSEAPAAIQHLVDGHARGKIVVTV